VDEIDFPYFRLLYDIYHMQIMEGDRACLQEVGYTGWLGQEFTPRVRLGYDMLKAAIELCR
jgi:hydroxypyruvate isomerase